MKKLLKRLEENGIITYENDEVYYNSEKITDDEYSKLETLLNNNKISKLVSMDLWTMFYADCQ